MNDQFGFKEEETAYIEASLELTAGDSGEEIDMSAWDEKADIVLPVDDLNGASRAMAGQTRPLGGQWRWQLPRSALERRIDAASVVCAVNQGLDVHPSCDAVLMEG
jgi:hypothetical protein